MTANAVLSAGHAGDHVLAHDQRRHRDAVAPGGIRHFHLPLHFTVPGVEREHPAIEGPHEYVTPADRHSPVYRAAARDDGADLGLVPP